MPMATERDPVRVLLYSHDSLGLGHVRRNLALAHALAEQLPLLVGRPVTGMLLTGIGATHGVDLPPGFDIVVLPGIRKGTGGYHPRHVHVPMADLLDVRGRMLAAAVTGFVPDLVIVDRHAYGVHGELRGALRRLRRDHPAAKIVLGLREVLDEPEATAREWAELGNPAALRTLYDQIWAYGDPGVHDLRRTGELPAALRDLVRFTGYLSSGRRWGSRSPVDPPYVMTTVGGGSDGQELCRVAAQAPVPAGHRHLILTGPQMPTTAVREIAALAGPSTTVVESLPEAAGTLRDAAAVVSMAGYNTVCELMATSTPALLVPRERPRLEQAIRADGLARTGSFEVCHSEDLTPHRLGDWLAHAVGRDHRRTGLDLRGLQAVPRLAAELVDAPAHARAQEVTGVAV